MEEIDLETKTNAPAWGRELKDKLTKLFENILGEIKTGNEGITEKITEMKTTLKGEIKIISDQATEAHKLAMENKTAIETMQNQLFSMHRRCNGLKAENERLAKQCDDLDCYSRRDNLVFRGIKEEVSDDDEEMSCTAALRSFFIDTLKINRTIVQKMVFVRVHRLGAKHTGDNRYHRPIIARFHDYNMRKLVWSKRYDIPTRTISMSENFANNVENRRRLLYPVLKKAKDSKQYRKSYMKGDSLILDEKRYTVNDNLDDLPSELHPRQFGWKSNNNHIVFGGIHSSYCFLSNYYQRSITHDGITHDTLEHLYQFKKAKRFGDTAAADRILCARSPSDAKYFGSRVQGFQSEDWDNVKGDIMLELLRCKFRGGSELAGLLQKTTGKSLAEAGRSKSFAIGLSINDKNIFDQSKWAEGGNLLGRSLMQIRDELNDAVE